ncbi:unnamed protein product [Symbiodinium natans]|uniref:Uncharacterized protein n=1 Tax=Symbiodinium natans TaxID=878477 RepID=A0A812L8E2_9DINO|nr:unnamed protein product [Symbiodinium natans]
MAGDPVDSFDYPGGVPLHRQDSVDSSSSGDSGPMMTRRDADGHLASTSASARRRREASLDFCPEAQLDQVIDGESPATVRSKDIETAAQEADDVRPFLEPDADKSNWCAVM